MRRYLTPYLWFEDRVSSLPTVHLIILSVVCLAAVGCVVGQALGLGDDLALLLADDEKNIPVALSGLLLLAAASLWLFAFLLAALCTRLILRSKGL